MFNFSANHLLLLSRMEYRSCAVFLMKDDSTRRVYRLYDFTPLLLRVGKGQQRGQTLPGHRVGQEGYQTQLGPAVTPGVDGAGEAPMN
jgi:hypothetical protein